MLTKELVYVPRLRFCLWTPNQQKQVFVKPNLINLKRTLSELKRLLGRMRNLNPSAAHFSYPTCETTRHSPRGQLLHLNDATKKKECLNTFFICCYVIQILMSLLKFSSSENATKIGAICLKV